MNITFRHFKSSCYNAVCTFLIELSMNERVHINWNWARWEWLFFHPDFDRDRMNKIGLWYCNINIRRYYGRALTIKAMCLLMKRRFTSRASCCLQRI